MKTIKFLALIALAAAAIEQPQRLRGEGIDQLLRSFGVHHHHEQQVILLRRRAIGFDRRAVPTFSGSLLYQVGSFLRERPDFFAGVGWLGAARRCFSRNPLAFVGPRLTNRLPSARKRQGKSAAREMPMRTSATMTAGVGSSAWPGIKGPAWIVAKARTVKGRRDGERLREFARSRTKFDRIVHSAPLLHQRQTQAGFQRADQHETVHLALDEDVQEPVNAVIQVNVGRAGGMGVHELLRAAPQKSVARLVARGGVGFGFHDDAAATVPVQFAADESRRRRSGDDGRKNPPSAWLSSRDKVDSTACKATRADRESTRSRTDARQIPADMASGLRLHRHRGRPQRADLRVLPGESRPARPGAGAAARGGRGGLHGGDRARISLRRGQLGAHHVPQHADHGGTRTGGARAGIHRDGPVGILSGAGRGRRASVSTATWKKRAPASRRCPPATRMPTGISSAGSAN